MEEKKTRRPEEPEEVSEPVTTVEEGECYVPRPRYQLVLAWALAILVALGFILWLLEIATGGSLFGLLG